MSSLQFYSRNHREISRHARLPHHYLPPCMLVRVTRCGAEVCEPRLPSFSFFAGIMGIGVSS